MYYDTVLTNTNPNKPVKYELLDRYNMKRYVNRTIYLNNNN